MIIRTCLCILLVLFVLTVSSYGKPHDDKSGPCVGMDCMHGVLMHGDEAQGEDHKAEDQYLRFKATLDTEKPRAGPNNAESEFHGVLMHGDSGTGEHHIEHNDAQPAPVVRKGPKDLSQMIHDGMHGEGDEGSKHSWDKDQISDDDKQRGPSNDKLMHGILMHGDANYVHEDNEDETELASKPAKHGPQSAEDYLHGVLMHGDDERGHAHDHHSSSEDIFVSESMMLGPNNDLHGILMHGDSEAGLDHSKEHTDMEGDVFSDISQIMGLGLDEDLLKMIDIEKILEKDQQEYAEWIINNPEFQDESMMGSTLADVSDTILSDIEIMKKRYLAKSNTDFETDNGKAEDEFPFTAENAMEAMDGDLEAEEGEDMRHDLELLGSTEPLNARHKVQQVLEKSKDEH